RYGDNDRLAARAAQMIGADVLVLLSDVDGLYTADPRSNPAPLHVGRIGRLSPEIEAMAGGANATAGVGVGGMATKLAAARIASAAGCATILTLGGRPSPLAAGEDGAAGRPPLAAAGGAERCAAHGHRAGDPAGARLQGLDRRHPRAGRYAGGGRR